MKSCGVIAEYNPFHTGHRYQLQQARKQSQAQVMVVAMSGHFVQRGEPAIFDKWLRAQQALRNGADLVLALPVLGSVQAADYFAQAGIHVLHQAKCDAISFGSETANVETLQCGLSQWQRVEKELHQYMKTDSTLQSYSYPVQLSRAVQTYFPAYEELFSLLQQPNHQLAFAYLKAMAHIGWQPEIYPILRKVADHNDQMIRSDQFASGTALRRALLTARVEGTDEVEQRFLRQLLVDTTGDLLTAPLMTWETFWHLLQYTLIVKTERQLCEIYQVSEGIEQRLKKFATVANSFQAFIALVKTRRWTQTKLQRICLYILLNVTQQEVDTIRNNREQPIQVLGFTKTGQRYLKQLHEEQPQRFVTNYAASKEALQLDYRYDELYAVAQGQPYCNQNIGRIPMRVE